MLTVPVERAGVLIVARERSATTVPAAACIARGARVAIVARRSVLLCNISALPVPAHVRRAVVVVGRTVAVALTIAVAGRRELAPPVRALVVGARVPIVADFRRAGHAPRSLARVEGAAVLIEVARRASGLLGNSTGAAQTFLRVSRQHCGSVVQHQRYQTSDHWRGDAGTEGHPEELVYLVFGLWHLRIPGQRRNDERSRW